MLTHGHVDHIGGNGALKQMAPHVRFALHEADLWWAENLDRHIAQLYAFGEPDAWSLDSDTEQAIRAGCGEPVAIDMILSHGDVVSFGAGRELEIIHVGGHSPGELLIRDCQTGAVFPGDALQGAGAMNVESGKRDFPMYRTVRQYLAALQQVEVLAPDVLCTAHLRSLNGADIAAAVQESRSWSEALTAEVSDILRDAGSLSLTEAAAAVSAAHPEYAVSLQINVTTAEHLNELLRRGQCRVSIDAGAKRWTWI
jgi:glyoxylase-like metal-dependent hydrolase (beta-lactamase superfamily II)